MWQYTFQIIEDLERPPLIIKARSLKEAVESHLVPYPLAALLVAIDPVSEE
jgi:hypothetical protein